MMQAVYHQFTDAVVEYKFKCRTPNINLAKYANDIAMEIYNMCMLKFKQEDLDYLASLRYMTCDFIEFLRNFKLNPNFVNVRGNGDFLEIHIVGPWWATILFEVPVLKIVHEVYSRNEHPDPDYSEGKKRLTEKIKIANAHKFKFVDFGTRRAFSTNWHKEVVRTLCDHATGFVGTSNVMLAKRYNVTPIGTVAHEFFQGCQGMEIRIEDSQKYALDKWSHEYRGDLGIALTDTLGIDKFLRDFDMYFAKLFDGVRHDSGDPLLWARKVIKHYESMGIDPKTKSAVFSDGLDFITAARIYEKLNDRINVSFGIGTNLTNDLGYQALQNVIKMTRCNGKPVAKISENPAKTMCEDEDYLKRLRKVIEE